QPSAAIPPLPPRTESADRIPSVRAGRPVRRNDVTDRTRPPGDRRSAPTPAEPELDQVRPTSTRSTTTARKAAPGTSTAAGALTPGCGTTERTLPIGPMADAASATAI